MKLDPLAQGHLQGTVIDPAPAGCKAWDEFPALFDIQEVLENVVHHGDKVKATVIDNAQCPPRRWNLFPHAGSAPPEGDEHEQNNANDACIHGGPSLVMDSGFGMAQLLPVRLQAQARAMRPPGDYAPVLYTCGGERS